MTSQGLLRPLAGSAKQSRSRVMPRTFHCPVVSLNSRRGAQAARKGGTGCLTIAVHIEPLQAFLLAFRESARRLTAQCNMHRSQGDNSCISLVDNRLPLRHAGNGRADGRRDAAGAAAWATVHQLQGAINTGAAYAGLTRATAAFFVAKAFMARSP